eukprot:gene20023-20553_t
MEDFAAFATDFQDGLEDEWSQIRLVATTASRALILAVADGPKEESEAKQGVLIRLWTPLLPRLCMNRFYAADAVRLASLSLWKDVMTVRFDGKQLLAERCEEAVAYYIRSSRTSTNHMVCEAACHAMLRNSVDWELSQAAVLLVRELSLLSTSESDLQSFQSLVKQVFHYSDILNESTLRAHESEGSFSFLDGLWLILLHRIQP